MEKIGKQIDRVTNEANQLRTELWTDYTVFTWQWWLLLSICIIFTFIFFRFTKKEKMLQAVAYFGVIFILNKYLDDFATAFDMYDYRMQLEPYVATMMPANLFAIPVSLSYIYQRFVTWKSFIIATLVFAAGVSYIALPLMEKADIYLKKGWSSHYSLLSLLAISIIAKLLIDKAKKESTH